MYSRDESIGNSHGSRGIHVGIESTTLVLWEWAKHGNGLQLREEYLYSAILLCVSKRSDMDHTVVPAN